MVNKEGTPPNKGIKSPSKLLSLKYQYQSSSGEQNRNSSSPKHVHFINAITLSSKYDEPRETGIVEPNTKGDDHDITVKVKEECKEPEEEGKKGNRLIHQSYSSQKMFYDDSCKEEIREDESAVKRCLTALLLSCIEPSSVFRRLTVKYNYSLLIGLSPDLTQVAICPIYHEPSIFVSANVMDRSIGIDNPCLSWTDISQANTVSFESDYGCPGNMSNSDELRHTDNTTLVPPRLPDTLPQETTTLGLLILPYVSPFPLTIRRTARISIPPIEPNLAKRARISAINLNDYQLDPLTPPPSPSSIFMMAAYQRMIDETDLTQREEALTETGQNSVPVPETALTVCTMHLRGQLHTILEDIDRYPNACLEELEAFMTLQMCEDVEDRASNAQEEARHKSKEALEEVIQRIYHNNN
ncbi:hypothetical protein Tco_1344350 [Tanacetum coccineum]